MEKSITRHAEILNAIIWATVMIAISLVIRGTEQNQEVVMILIAGWLMSSFIFHRKNKRAN